MIKILSKQRRYPIDSASLQEIIDKLLLGVGYPDFDIGILFVPASAMRKYNKQYRNKDLPTDVLSFPYYPDLKPRQRIKAHSSDEKNLGDIIICPEYVWKQFSDSYDWNDISQKAKQALLNARIIVLIVHGLCHLLGYDHATAAQYKSMRRKELRLLRSLIA